MGLKIVWTPDAEKSFSNIIDFIEAKWTGKEVNKFVSTFNNAVNQISITPEMFPASSQKNILKAVLTKQNSLFYQVRKNEIVILIIWDNRQNPKHNIYK